MTETTRHKRGDIREDGMVFWAYDKTCKGGERWLSPEKFDCSQRKVASRMREYRNVNKDTIVVRMRGYNAVNKEKIAARDRERYAANKEKIAVQKRGYNAVNKEKIAARDRGYKANPEVKARRREHYANRHAADPLFNLVHRLRCRTAQAFRNIAAGKPAKTQDLLGADWVTVEVHIESQFTDGMSWGNRHLWHVDHRVPLSSAKTMEELVKLCHHTNLQPLWAADNFSKGSKCPITGKRHRLQPLDSPPLTR